MENKGEGKSEKFFREFGKKMDQFMGEVREAGDRAQADLQTKFEELKTAGKKFQKEAQNNERWKEVETSLNKAGKEFEKAFASAFKKRNGEGKSKS
jgi:hypothetical protein